MKKCTFDQEVKHFQAYAKAMAMVGGEGHPDGTESLEGRQ